MIAALNPHVSGGSTIDAFSAVWGFGLGIIVSVAILCITRRR